MSTRNEKLNNSTDNRGEYKVLIDSVKLVSELPGLTCEIGVRAGGSSYKIMREKQRCDDKSIHIGIDPFGNILWTTEGDKKIRLDYNNKMKRKMLRDMYAWCCENELEFLYFPLEDTEFFKRYSDGVPIYDEEKRIENQYKLVFFDGPHQYEPVKVEVDFFIDKIPSGGVMVFDDWEWYDHSKIQTMLLNRGYSTGDVENNKGPGASGTISYIKK